MDIFPACMCVHCICAWYLGRPKESTGFLRIGITWWLQTSMWMLGTESRKGSKCPQPLSLLSSLLNHLFKNVLPHSFHFSSSLSAATQLAPTLLSDTFFLIFICTSFKNMFHLFLFLLPLLPMFFSFFLSASFPSTSGVYKNISEASDNLMNGLRFGYFSYGIYALGIFISGIEVRRVSVTESRT